LAQLSAPQLPKVAALETDLDNLTAYAVEIRYPGVEVKQAQAQAALQTAEAIRQLVRHALGLSAGEN
jgi:hypothetical protein